MKRIKNILGVAISLAVLLKLSEMCEHFLPQARLLIHSTLGLTPAPISLFPATPDLPYYCCPSPNLLTLFPAPLVGCQVSVLHQPSKSAVDATQWWYNPLCTCDSWCPISVGECKQFHCMEGWEVVMAPQSLSQEILQCFHPLSPPIQVEPVPIPTAYPHFTNLR